MGTFTRENTNTKMNNLFLNPDDSNALEHIEERLSSGRTTCCQWNRRGNVLAAGTTKGTIVLWCFDTRAVVREFRNNNQDSEERRRRRKENSPQSAAVEEEEEEEEEEVSFPIRCLCWRRDNRKIAGMPTGTY